MLLGRVEWLVAANGGLQAFGQHVIAAVLGNGRDVSGFRRGVVDLYGPRDVAWQQTVGQRANLLRLLACPGFKRPDGDLGLGEDMRDVLDHVTPAARLGGQPVKHLRRRECAARLCPKAQGGGPLGIIGPDRQPDAQAVPAKGRGKARHTVSSLRVELALAKILRQRAKDVLLADDQPIIAIECCARHFDLDAPQRALPGGPVARRQTPRVADQSGKQPRAGASRPPKRGAVVQERLAIVVEKDLQRG